MSETKDLLRRGSEGFAPREGIMDSLIRRRDRKRRNQRIAAGVVGIAAFVGLVWIVTSGLSFDRTQTPAATGPVETGPVVTDPVVTDPVETAPAETGPAQTAPPSAPASAGPDLVRQGTCSDGARSHLELTDIGDRIKVRFVLHQMTLPGHRWRIVLRHGATIAGPGNYRVFFEGTRLATGDSGDLAVQQSVVNTPVIDWVKATARDRQTGQICGVHDGPL